MATHPIPDRTVLVTPTGLATVLRATRRNGADGYDITTPHSPYSRFMPDWCAHPAVVGGNVCDKPYGTHWCGLTHVDPVTLARLPRKDT